MKLRQSYCKHIVVVILCVLASLVVNASERRLHDLTSQQHKKRGLFKRGSSLKFIKSNYPEVVEGVPAEFQKVVVEYAKEKFGKDYLERFAQMQAAHDKTRIYGLQYEAIAKSFGFGFYYRNGYVYVGSPDLMRGHRTDDRFKNEANIRAYDAKRRREKDASSLLDDVVQNYKIHLMPQGYMVDTLVRLLSFLKNHPELGDSIAILKLKINFDDEQMKKNKNGDIFPKIVLYPSSGKNHAQRVLNALCDEFARVEGLDICPRYNERITSLIYVSQGDGDFKDEKYKRYYEPERVYYRADITGKKRNYRLKCPGRCAARRSIG